MTMVYRNYTAEELQQQYSARAAVPEHADIFRQWQVDSENYRAKANLIADLSYGDGERQKLDLFLPDIDTNETPLFIFIHGGYWQSMDKDFSSFVAEKLNQRGIAVAVLNYALCPAVTIDMITTQIRRATIWLWANASLYGIDTSHMHLCGHSAGGHLIAALMATDWQGIYPDFDSSAIRSALSLSGVFDLEPLIYTGMNQALKLDPESARQNSPLHMQPRLNIPFVLLVGGNETDEFHRQSQGMARTWARQGIKTVYHSLAELNHFTIINDFLKADSELLGTVLKLVHSQ